MSAKLTFVAATAPTPTTGADVCKNAPISPVEHDQNNANLRAEIETKSPLAGPGSGQAFSVGVVSTPGIAFPAAQVASVDPNTLDDYKEGSWVPVVTFGGVSVSVSGTGCLYTKIGNATFVRGAVIVTRGTQIGLMRFTGFPVSANRTIAVTVDAAGVSDRPIMAIVSGGDCFWVGYGGSGISISDANTPATAFAIYFDICL